MTLLKKYEQLRNKADKVWLGYHYYNNYTLPKYKKSIIIHNKIWDIIVKLKNK